MISSKNDKPFVVSKRAQMIIIRRDFLIKQTAVHYDHPNGDTSRLGFTCNIRRSFDFGMV